MSQTPHTAIITDESRQATFTVDDYLEIIPSGNVVLLANALKDNACTILSVTVGLPYNKLGSIVGVGVDCDMTSKLKLLVDKCSNEQFEYAMKNLFVSAGNLPTGGSAMVITSNDIHRVSRCLMNGRGANDSFELAITIHGVGQKEVIASRWYELHDNS